LAVAPVIAVTGATANRPTSIIHATTELEPISRLDRVEHKVDPPKQKAAPMPARTATTDQLAPSQSTRLLQKRP